MPASTFFGSPKNSNTSFIVMDLTPFLSAPDLAITNALSSSVNQREFSGKSETRKKAAMPSKMVTIPSRMKIHRQLL